MNLSPDIQFRKLRRAWRQRAEEAGARDGKAAVPGLDDVRPAAFESLLQQEANEALLSLEARLQAADSELKREFQVARTDYLATQNRYLQKRRELGDRPIQIEIGLLQYWGVVLLVSACELPINLRVFLDLLPEAELMSVLTATSLTLLLFVLAHFAGKAFRQKHESAFAPQRVMGIIGVLLSAVIVAGLAYLRQVFYSHPEDPETLAKAFGYVDPTVLTIFFVAVNAALIVVGTWLGMKRHDPDPTYEQRWREYQRARKAAVGLAGKREKTRALYFEAATGAVSMFRKLLGRYREVNMENRDLKSTPQVWIEHPIEKVVSLANFKFEVPDNELEVGEGATLSARPG